MSGRVLVTFAALALITGACSPGTGASISLKAIGIDGASVFENRIPVSDLKPRREIE